MDRLTGRGEKEMEHLGEQLSERYGHLGSLQLRYVGEKPRMRLSAQALGTKYVMHAWHRHRSPPIVPQQIADSRFEKAQDHMRYVEVWGSRFLTPITERFNKDLRTEEPLQNADTFILMHLCRFETGESPKGDRSPFCRLFSAKEWRDYLHWYNLKRGWVTARFFEPPLSRSAFVRTLIERLRRPPHASLFVEVTNITNLMQTLYALHAFDGIERLSSLQGPRSTRVSRSEAGSRLEAINFGSRVVVEKLLCGAAAGRRGRGSGDGRAARTVGGRSRHARVREWTAVRMLVDDAVVRMPFCDSDARGLCELRRFIQGLEAPRTPLWPEMRTR